MTDPATARLWVALRREATEGQGQFMALVPFGEGAYGAPTAPPLKIDGAEAQVRLRVVGKGWTYEEAWASLGSTLVGVVVRSPGHVDAAEVVQALLAGPPDTPRPPGAATAVLDRLALPALDAE